MRKASPFPIFGFIFLLLLAGLAGWSTTWDVTVPVENRTHPGQFVGRLIAPEGSGSAFPIKVTEQGFTVLLTAKHVVEASTVASTVFRLHEVTVPVVRVEMHPTEDAALVWVQAHLPVIPVSFEPLAFGDRVQGAGWIFGEYLTLGEGLISTPGALSIDVLPGCSGGAILRGGAAVGIISASIRVGGPFGAIPIGASADFVEISRLRPWLDATIGR